MGVRVKDIALGIVLGIGAFSFALATSQQSEDTVPGCAIRAAGTLPLQFTTPFLAGSTNRDLGDAAFGTQIVRWVRAKGGVPPLGFTSDHNNPSFSPVDQTGIGPSISLSDAVTKQLPLVAQADPTKSSLLSSGRLQGVFGVPVSVGMVPMYFDVSVYDNGSDLGQSKIERFQLTMVDANVFKFARDVLGGGETYHSYFDVVDVVAGAPPFTFSISGPITLTDNLGNVAQINSVPSDPIQSLLNQVGLFLNANTGEISGTPLLSGLLKIPMSCMDSNGLTALSRDKSSSGQTISINIGANTRVNSACVTTKLNIRGDTRTRGKDTIKYVGLANLGNTLATLNQSMFTLSIGNYTSPEVLLDANGRGSVGKGKGGAVVTVRVKTKGDVIVEIRGESFGWQGSILSDITARQAIVPVSVKIENRAESTSFQSSEVLRMDVKARNPKFHMSYKFGPGDLGGGFLITAVHGKDDKANIGDAWKIRFIFMPPNPGAFGDARIASVGIGTSFTDFIGLTNAKGKIKEAEKRNPMSARVIKIGLDAKGKGFLETGTLPEFPTATNPNTQTRIPLAKQTLARNRFAFSIEFENANGNTLFGAEDGTWIHTDGRSIWSSTKLKQK